MGLMQLSYDYYTKVPQVSPKYRSHTRDSPKFANHSLKNVRLSATRKAFNLNLAQSGDNRDMIAIQYFSIAS
jgi:hypothetical protein